MMLHTLPSCLFFFFFNDTATTEIYTLSLHDALPISGRPSPPVRRQSPRHRTGPCRRSRPVRRPAPGRRPCRSEEHTSELQSQSNLVCRLLLEKKKKHNTEHQHIIVSTTARERRLICL